MTKPQSVNTPEHHLKKQTNKKKPQKNKNQRGREREKHQNEPKDAFLRKKSLKTFTSMERGLFTYIARKTFQQLESLNSSVRRCGAFARNPLSFGSKDYS